ncbi:MAG: hypothetical protein ACLP7Q_09220 [Isosphaeraceae bacterium]
MAKDEMQISHRSKGPMLATDEMQISRRWTQMHTDKFCGGESARKQPEIM